ncbi:hypothetical protein GCM10010286_01970 [Streptomyces toxytricini]|nr:hypothetical protein GCM10010286_01970 [Streptomyces toxytricini]
MLQAGADGRDAPPQQPAGRDRREVDRDLAVLHPLDQATGFPLLHVAPYVSSLIPLLSGGASILTRSPHDPWPTISA